MRRLVTALAILIVVLVAGMSALVLLINPNQFRGYMVQQVEQKSGYVLSLESDLRWHVWPRLSILSGPLTLTAPGADTPTVSAENMRIDVRLWPLFSHQLSVEQVMLKGAVIQLTDNSNQPPVKDAPIAPPDSQLPVTHSGWQYALDNLQLNDSLLVWQRGDDQPINIRHINLSLSQNAARQANISFSGQIKRNQRELTLSFQAQADLSQAMARIDASVTQLNYQLQGIDLPESGIFGQGTLHFHYQRQPQQQWQVTDLMLSANDSQLAGSLGAKFSVPPQFSLALNATTLDLDNLLGWQQSDSDPATLNASPPVIDQLPKDRDDHARQLVDYEATVALNADKLIYRGLPITHFQLKAVNQQGILTINPLRGSLTDGEFSLPAQVDVTKNPLFVRVTPHINHVSLSDVLAAAQLPIALSGYFSLEGDIEGSSLDKESWRKAWQGSGHFQLDQGSLLGINMQQLVQQTIVRNNNAVQATDNYLQNTTFDSFSFDGQFARGALTMSNLQANSPQTSIAGSGLINFADQQCDLALNVRIPDGWKGNAQWVDILRQASIPLHIYGPWSQLNYQVETQSLLRGQLQERAKKALDALGEKSKNSKALDSKEKKELDGILNKLQ